MVWEEQNVCLSISFLRAQGERVRRKEAPDLGPGKLSLHPRHILKSNSQG